MSTSSPLDDLLSVRLCLRPDVRCAIHESGGDAYYQLEDPLTSNFYRLGVREWSLARRLDGSRTLGELVEAQSSEDPGNCLSVEEALGLGRWLAHTQLATHGDAKHPLFARPAATAGRMPAWMNPAFLRLPLGNPDRLISLASPWMLWSVSPIAVVVWLAALIGGMYQIGLQWERFREPMQTVLAPDNWIQLIFVWVVLKVIHEFFHGLVCKKYGGRIPSCGLMFILFSPVAYVDVTSSWKFRSKWHRIFTAAAGMYSELFIAAIAAFVWASTDQPLLSQTCYNVMMTAGVSTLLFNGNFLMRFDGYYILSDLLGLQNLYSGGQQFVQSLCRKYFFGLPTKSVAASRYLWFVKLYGVASLIWRISFYIGILLTASTMFRGAGVVISAMIGAAWIGLPAIRLVAFLVCGRGNERPSLLRFSCAIGTIGIVLAAALALPWPSGIAANGVVEYEPLAIVRSSADGFLRNWHVNSGDVVKPGQPLAVIENPQTEFELADVQGRIERSEIEMMVLRDEKKYESLASKARDLEALRDERSELADKVQALKVVAPSGGRVIVRDQDSLVNQYVDSGETVLSVGQEDRKAVVVLVAQKDVDFFLKQRGSTPSVRIKGRMQRIDDARLTKVNPRATRTLRHPALAAPNGGPLAVVPQPTSGDEPATSDFKLVEPHFTAVVSLSRSQSSDLRAGELARVRIGAAGETVGAHLWAVADRWIRRRLSPMP